MSVSREGEVFRRVFERVVEACIASDLVGGEGFAVDASLIAADANKQRSIAGQDWHKDRAVKEYLATLDDTAWGAASAVVPKFVSPSDPAAQWTGAHKGPAFFTYSDNYLIDVKFGVIVDVEAPRAIRQAEVGAARTMIERTEERFGLKPERLAADTAYGTAPMLNWLVEEKDIAPHIPVFDRSKRDDGTFKAIRERLRSSTWVMGAPPSVFAQRQRCQTFAAVPIASRPTSDIRRHFYAAIARVVSAPFGRPILGRVRWPIAGRPRVLQTSRRVRGNVNRRTNPFPGSWRERNAAKEETRCPSRSV
jgi:hypothetical protein